MLSHRFDIDRGAGRWVSALVSHSTRAAQWPSHSASNELDPIGCHPDRDWSIYRWPPLQVASSAYHPPSTNPPPP